MKVMKEKVSSQDCLEGNKEYYRENDIKIEDEETISNSLRDEKQLCIECLQEKLPYGRLVARFLRGKNILKDNIGVVEVGGGYGHLMFELIKEVSPKGITMLDINKHLLEKQKSLLGKRANYICEDVCKGLPKLKPDLVISNEMIADLPDASRLIKIIKQIGANAFITEYSCEYSVPEPWQNLYKEKGKRGEPKIVQLDGHCEQAMKFSTLKQAAEKMGFEVEEGSLIELVGLRNDDWIQRVITNPQNFLECMMGTFVNKLKLFRYLVLRNVH